MHQSVIYKTVATIPSPADSVRGLRDSISVFGNKGKNDFDFFWNIHNVVAYGYKSGGFSFAYADPDKEFPYFTFTVYAFPNVPYDFQLNKLYENITLPGALNPTFLGTHTGNDGMTYFVNNVYPSDAEPPSSKTYTSVIFTKKIKIPLPPNFIDTAIFGSGHILGYRIDYYNHTDTTKYRNRWDFTVDFTDLRMLQ